MAEGETRRIEAAQSRATIQAEVGVIKSEVERLRGHVATLYGRDKELAVLKAKVKWLWTGIGGAGSAAIGSIVSQFMGGGS